MSKNTSKLMQFAQGTVVLTVSNLLIKATNFFLLPLYTSYLTPDQLGISDSITSLSAFIFPLLVLAFDSAFSAFYYEKDDEQYKRSVFNTTLFFLAFMSLFTIIPIIFSTQISSLMFKTDDYSLAIKLAMFSIAVNLWFLPYSLIIRMNNKMKTFSVVSFISSLSMILLNIFFVTKLRWGYFSLIFSALLVNILQLFMFIILGKSKPNVKLFDIELFKKMLRYALPIVPVVLAGWILSLSDRYILLYFAGEYQVGIYGIAARFLNVLTVITSSIYNAFAAFAFAANKDEDAKSQYIFILDIIHVILTMITIVVSVFSSEILKLMVNENYYSANVLVGPLLLGQVCYAANTIMGYGFAYKKKSAYFLIPTFSGAIINVILNVILIPKYGAFAAAITTFIGYFIMMIITYVLSQIVYKCNYHFANLMVSIIMSLAIILVSPYLGLTLRIVIFLALCMVFLLLYKESINNLVKKLKNNIIVCNK